MVKMKQDFIRIDNSIFRIDKIVNISMLSDGLSIRVEREVKEMPRVLIDYTDAESCKAAFDKACSELVTNG